MDQRLTELDVRLTQGGEPTFVANHDRDEPEWNTEAMGPTKRKKAIELYHRMRDRYGAGGLVHFGQGKSYRESRCPVVTELFLAQGWRADLA